MVMDVLSCWRNRIGGTLKCLELEVDRRIRLVSEGGYLDLKFRTYKGPVGI